MSIDGGRQSDVGNDAGKPDSNQPSASDSPRSQKSVAEKLLDAMAENRIIGRDNPRKFDDGTTKHEAHGASDTDNPESTPSSAPDTPRVRKPVNEELLDAMAEGRVIRREDSRETGSDTSRSEDRSDTDEQAGAAGDIPNDDRDEPAAEMDTRPAANGLDEKQPDHDLLLGVETGDLPEGDQIGEVVADQTTANDATAWDAQAFEEAGQAPDTDETPGPEEAPAVTSSGAERATVRENQDQPLPKKDAHAAVVDESGEHARPGESDVHPGVDVAVLGDGTEGRPVGDRSGNSVAAQTSEDSVGNSSWDQERGEQEPGTDETLDVVDEPVDTGEERKDVDLVDRDIDAHAGFVGTEATGSARLSDTEIEGREDFPGQPDQTDMRGEDSNLSESAAFEDMQDLDVGGDAEPFEDMQDLDVGGDAEPSRPEVPDVDGIDQRFSAPEVVQRLSGEMPSPRKPFAALDNLEPNAAYEVPNRGTFYTDDTGKVVHVEAQYGRTGALNWDLMKPQPDVTYVVNDHVFVTDHAGRTIEAYADDLQIGDADRSRSIQGRIGNIGGEEYDGGHLLANMFAGGPEDINLVPMLSDLNQGNSPGDTFYAVEQELRAKLRPPPDAGPDWEPPSIKFKVLPEYEGESRVPIAITVEYTVDGDTERRRFLNE
ncbi:DNA/RNA non-specific endonuclease [Promicromonospora vindobonensis]|uniref:DNA/RNA non-specific endonuclease n=1 Tax=Promicromonospora vindobonensis TaxID=195748 RepID=A0ABW5VWA4_9MICO